MSVEKTKEEIIQHKKKAMSKLNTLFENYIASDDKNLLKKTDLLSYWVEEYSNYISNEHNFDAKRLKSYKRGDIIKVNFGFNVGAEYGGLHYAVVINNNNHRNSPVLTVIPLTSHKKGKDIYPDDVFLGNEIYKALKLKYDTLMKNLDTQQVETALYLESFKLVEELAKQQILQMKEYEVIDEEEFTKTSQKAQEHIEALNKLLSKIKEQDAENKIASEQLLKTGSEISNMKIGSIALVSQITTISKMKIYDPRNAKGVLHGIKLSSDSINKINERLKQLYIYE